MDALRQMGDSYDGPPRVTSGLVEMQRLFMQEARKKGLRPAAAVREDSPAFGKPQPPGAGKVRRRLR